MSSFMNSLGFYIGFYIGFYNSLGFYDHSIILWFLYNKVIDDRLTPKRMLE